MKNYPNIEKHRNFDGSRTCYDAGGRSWQIKGTTGNWSAIASVTRQGSLNVISGCATLQEISNILSKTGVEP